MHRPPKSTLKIVVLYFAAARELARRASETFSFEEEEEEEEERAVNVKVSVADVKARILARRPELSECLKTCAFSVDREYAASDAQEVHDGSEVALIPPISGG